jgi:glycosyltransferase involved in cell wall biosynthesis
MAAKLQRRVYFSYAAPAGFSGQRAATELVIQGLRERGWDCRSLPLPVLRDEGRPARPVRFGLAVLGAWLRSLRLLPARGSCLCVNLGQTRFALLRDAVPLLAGRMGLGRNKVVVALHGSLFMRWTPGSLDCRIFRLLLGQAGTVVALGESQRRRLIELGIAHHRIEVLVNTCEQPVMDPDGVRAKHAAEAGPRPLQALFLSSLIDTKGYPEFLAAARRLSAEAGPQIEAVVCGKVAASPYAEKLRDPAEAVAWIDGQVAALNQQGRVRARWIRGAAGPAKAQLFRDADLFLLPTRYAVEAQPLVLLEAMAAGCAIIASGAGEIPTILDGETAVLIDPVTDESVAAAWRALAADPARRLSLGLAANRRYAEHFTREQHLGRWEAMLAGDRRTEDSP